jgi:hypothetical protein
MRKEFSEYYYACGFLWLVLSSLEYIFEDVVQKETLLIYKNYYEESNDLAAWLLDEVFYVQSKDDQISTLNKIEKYEPKTLLWAEAVSTSARTNQYSATVDTESFVLYLSFRWVLAVLTQFDSLVKDTASEEISKRYVKGLPEISGLSTWILTELIELMKKYNFMKDDVENSSIDSFINLLAKEWSNTVLAAASEHI